MARKPGAPCRSRPARKVGLLLFMATFVLYGTSPVVTNWDSYLAFPTAVSLVHERDLDLDEFRVPSVQDHYAAVRAQGHTFDSSPWPVSFFAVPAVVLVDAAHAIAGSPNATELVNRGRMQLPQLLSASAVTALVVVIVFVIAYEHLSGAERRRRRLALVVAVVFATGTAAWSTTSRALWQHGPSMLALGLAVLVAARIQRSGGSAVQAAALGATLAAGATIRPTNAVAATLLSAWLVLHHRRWIAAYALAAATVLVVYGAVNALAFGRLIPAYSSPGRRLALHPDYAEAMAANLLSPSRGLLVFSPVLLLAVVGVVLRRRARQLDLLDVVIAGSVLGQLLVVSASREGWWAGHAFGPRFMSDVLPFLAFLAVPAVDVAEGWAGLRRVSLAALVSWSIAVNAQGAYLRAVHCWNTVPVDIDADPQRVWSLDRPQVVEGWRILVRSPREAVSGRCAPTAPAKV